MNLGKKRLFLAAYCLTFVLYGCGKPTAVPKSYKTYSDDQQIFKVLYPEGWARDTGGRPNYSRAKFTSGNAQIEVEADLITRVLITEIAATGVSPMSMSGDLDSSASTQKVHWLETSKFAEQYGAKEEKAVNANMKLGKGQKSEFTSTDTFGNEMHGYRATGVCGDKRIRVVCLCPAGEWDSLKSAFDFVIESVEDNSPKRKWDLSPQDATPSGAASGADSSDES